MRFQRKKVAVALAYAFAAGGAAMLLAGPVSAQIKVEVTGSNIKRVEGEGSLPVQVITRDQIDKSGSTTAMELLQLVTSNNSFGNISFANVIGATTFSAQTASLRGLGGGRTLVLINGKRVDTFAGEIQGVQGVNLAVIPFAAIERVEILKDGASAIYGSDAIAGVINFIVRQDYQGAEATAYYGAPTRSGGGAQYTGSGAVGWGDLAKDRYNVFLSLSYNRQKHLDQADRNFSNNDFIPGIGLNGLSSNTFPGNVTTGGIGVVANGGVAAAPDKCAPSSFIADLNRCLFNPGAVHGVQQIPDDKLWNAFGSGRYQINSDWQAYATGLYSRDETTYQIQPVPISSVFNFGPNTDIPATVTLQPTSPFYPHALAAAKGVDGKPLNVRWRDFEGGFRNTTDTNENAQGVLGVKGTWRNWDLDASGFYSEGKTKDHLNNGFPRYSIILPLLNSGTVNLFGPNTPEISSAIKAANYVGDTLNATSKNYGIQGKGSTDIYQLPAGPLALAVGGEARKEKLDENANPVLATGDLSGFGGNVKSVSGDRKIYAAFAEVNVPIVKTLEGTVAVRYDHYSDFGSTTNPKGSLRWQPTQNMLFRGSYGTGFLAPSLYQLFTPNIGGVSAAGGVDPARCPITKDPADCAGQFTLLFGGNQNLKPEKSEQVTAGFIIDFPPNLLSFGADYFKINLKDAITNGIPFTTILGDLARYGNLVTRRPSDPATPNLPGAILQIQQTYINIGAVHIQGVDVEAHLKPPATDFGTFRVDVNGTYFIKYDNQNSDGTFSGQVSNQFLSATQGVIPRYKQYATLNWNYGPWAATLANTWQVSYTDVQTDANGDNRTVGSLSLWDIQGTYSGFKNVTLTLGVKNLRDTDPPVSNQNTTFQMGFDPSYYDARARFVYGSIRYAFK